MPFPHGRRIGLFVSALVCLLWGEWGTAQESLRVRAAVSPEKCFVGQKFLLTIDVMTTEFFTGQPAIQIPKIAAVALLPDPLSKGPLTDTIQGTTYSGVSFHFVGFPLKPGQIEIPPCLITTFQNDDQGRRLEKHPIMIPCQLEAILPPGAEELSSLICTPKLETTISWDPPLSMDHVSVKLGDALTRTVTLTAPDVLGMVLPPLPQVSLSGLRAYPAPAIVKDDLHEEDLVGKRVETVTYVCQQPGHYELPEILIPWYDTRNHLLRQAKIPRLIIDVTAPPVAAASPSSSAHGKGTTFWLAFMGSVLALNGMALVLRKRLHVFARSREQLLFSAVGQACHSNRPRDAAQAILKWIAELGIDPGASPFASLSANTSSPKLTCELQCLDEATIAPDSDWQGGPLWHELKQIRRKRRQPRFHSMELPQLN